MSHQKNFQHYRPINDIVQAILVLHCNYNGEIGQKLDLVITFDRRALLTEEQRLWAAFCKIFSGTRHLTRFGALKYVPKYDQICIFGAYSYSQNLQYKFLDWKWPPVPLALFRKFVRLGTTILPLVLHSSQPFTSLDRISVLKSHISWVLVTIEFDPLHGAPYQRII